MTLRPGESPGRAVAVFPFLKTSGPITLGNFTFLSTNDTSGLAKENAAHVREVADMLYLQDDLRIESATYTILTPVDLDHDEKTLQELRRIQSVVAFCYSHPHRTFGIPFFSSDQASLAVFSPEPVPIFLVRPEHNVQATHPLAAMSRDEWERVPGYYGRYNFRHPFWVAKDSRVYPHVPHIGLNHSQDLAYDLARCFETPTYHLLPRLINEAGATADRVLRALGWFNRANTMHVDDDTAILDLSVAFETLLGLPKDAKTERFVDAISLLLGRVERLDTWATQFYDARSDVAHEGQTTRSYFAPLKQKGQTDAAPYQSHLVYGRQIFQLCVGAVLFGSSLSKNAGIAEKFITNEERLQFVCKTIADESQPLEKRFKTIAETVDLIDNFRFVGETGPLIKTIAGAVQGVTGALLRLGIPLDPALKAALEAVANAPRSHDFYEVLDALKNLHYLKAPMPADLRSPEWIARRLAEAAWHYSFGPYFWLTEQHNNQISQSTGNPE